MNIIELLVQLCLELIRTLITEELSRLVRRRAQRIFGRRVRKPLSLAERIHVRVRKRLLHRLTTEDGLKL
jgi:hypothetical protein